MTNPAETRVAQQFAQAQTLQQQGQLASARRIYQEILDAEPHHYDALNAMGVLAGQSKDLRQAHSNRRTRADHLDAATV